MTYQCPDQICKGSGIVCGGDFFCMKGDCSIQTPTQSQDTGTDIAELNAVNAAGEDVKQQKSQTEAVQIFAGEDKRCSDDAAGFSNCCRDDGWGQDIHLAHCTDEEKQLGLAKEKGLTIEIGRYCARDALDICLSYKKSYCVFDSKIGLDVQRDGRDKQLHIPFGDAEHPNCRGLSPEELQRIDFSKVDLSNVVDDIKNNMNLPNKDKIQQQVEAEIAKGKWKNGRQVTDA